MKNTLLIFQIILAIILTFFIFIQSSGSGFNRSWKGPSSFTRRGLEKVVFRLTFFISGIFIAVSILSVLL